MKRAGPSLALVVIAAMLFPGHAVGQQTVSSRLVGVSAGAVVQGSVNLRGEGSAATGVRRIEIAINNTVMANQRYDDLRQEGSVGYRWDTMYQPGSTPRSYNREYTVKVTVTARGGATDSTTARVRVNNPPVTPSGVSASWSGQTVTVTWDPNPEPDITGYHVERDSGSGFVTIARDVGTTSYQERRNPGHYSYRVVAVRPSSASSDPLTSSPSAAAAVSVAAPPPARNSGGRAGRGGAEGGGGAAGARGASGRASSFSAGGHRLATVGLPRGAALPGVPGLPQEPRVAGSDFEWGTYDTRLPYDASDPGMSRLIELGTGNIAALSPDRVIPPDGLRWVAAGFLLVAAAALLRLLALRMEPAPVTAAAADARGTPVSRALTSGHAAARRWVRRRLVAAGERIRRAR